ncbi:MAG: hypothetical protein DMF56_18125 [Acidobacteria bacterium]|nr:MAG: hypothetical protein DMF56_18125 [Acidobacteriota bacterium]
MGGTVKRVLVTATTLVISVSALAQNTATLRDRDRDLEGAKKVVGEIQKANIHSGRFYMFSRIRLSDAGFSEDVYLPTGDVRGGINLRIEAPNRLYFVPHRKVVFSFDATPAYSFLGTRRTSTAGVKSKTGQFDYALRADAHFLFNHLYLDVYGMQNDQLRAQVADINRLATLRENEFGAGGEMKYSSRTSAFFTARFRDMSFPQGRVQPSDTPVNLLDRTEKNGRVSLHHKTFPLTTLFLAAEGSKYEFDRATFKDSSRRYAGAGFIRASGRTTLRVEAGQTQLDFEDPAQLDFSGVTADASLSRATGRWTTMLGATRDLGFSIMQSNNYYISNSAHLALNYVATRKLTLRGGAAGERDDYEVAVGGIKRRDTLTFSSIGFIYAFSRLSTGVDVGWFTRESNFTEDDSGIRWVLHLSFTP